jgi:hypothetical protein
MNKQVLPEDIIRADDKALMFMEGILEGLRRSRNLITKEIDLIETKLHKRFPSKYDDPMR